MNRLVCTSLERPKDLPPPKRQGPARVMFVHGLELGFSTVASNLEQYMATRDDIDAVHLQIARPLWVRIAGMHNLPLGRLRVGIPYGDNRQMLAYRALLGRLFRRWYPMDRFDCVHLMTQQRSLITTTLAGRTSTRFVVGIDATAMCYYREFRGRSPMSAGQERRIFSAADAVSCFSNWAADSVAQDYNIDRRKLFMYRPCVMVSGPRTRIEREPGPIRIIFIGNDWVGKGGPRLIRWHQEHWRDIAEIHVCSAGAPKGKQLTNVIWHGATPHAKLIQEILPRMDMAVIPTYLDTLLIAAQEAQSQGLPVVPSRRAGIPDIVKDGRTGILCSPLDDAAYITAVDGLIKDAGLRRSMSNASLEHGRRNLDSAVWHRHFADQIVAVADGRPLSFSPPGVQ